MSKWVIVTTGWPLNCANCSPFSRLCYIVNPHFYQHLPLHFLFLKYNYLNIIHSTTVWPQEMVVHLLIKRSEVHMIGPEVKLKCNLLSLWADGIWKVVGSTINHFLDLINTPGYMKISGTWMHFYHFANSGNLSPKLNCFSNTEICWSR